MKPDYPHVSIRSDTKWSHFEQTSKAKLLIPSSWKSHKDFIQDVHWFLMFISFLTPPTNVVLPAHVEVSLRRVIHTCRLPTAVPTTWKPPPLPSDLLARGSHSSNAGSSAPDTPWKVSPWFYCVGVSFPCLWPFAQHKALYCLQMFQSPGLFFLLTLRHLHH